MGERLSDKLEQLKAIESGGGVQHLLNEAHKILGNPIIMHDMEYKLMAHTENIVTDDPIWNELVTTDTVTPDRLELYKDEGFFDAVANAEKVTYLISDKLKYDRIFGKLFIKDLFQVGCVVITACDKTFEDDDLELFEVFCDILSEELSRDEFYQNYGQTYLETLVGKLIDGDIEDKKLYIAHVESIYHHCKENLYLTVVDIAKCDPEYTRLAYFRDFFKRTQPCFEYAVYSNFIVIIVSTDDVTLNVEKGLNGLNGLFEEYNLYAGVSSRFDNLFELRKYYKEAVSALNHGLSGGSGRRIFLFDEIV